MTTSVARYLMNPAEDVILFGAQLADGMWVLPEDPIMRWGNTEDERLRSQRFRRITRLAPREASPDLPPQITFIGEWVDGYQEVWHGAELHAWLVKKNSLPGETES